MKVEIELSEDGKMAVHAPGLAVWLREHKLGLRVLFGRRDLSQMNDITWPMYSFDDFPPPEVKPDAVTG